MVLKLAPSVSDAGHIPYYFHLGYVNFKTWRMSWSPLQPVPNPPDNLPPHRLLLEHVRCDERVKRADDPDSWFVMPSDVLWLLDYNQAYSAEFLKISETDEARGPHEMKSGWVEVEAWADVPEAPVFLGSSEEQRLRARAPKRAQTGSGGQARPTKQSRSSKASADLPNDLSDLLNKDLEKDPPEDVGAASVGDVTHEGDGGLPDAEEEEELLEGDSDSCDERELEEAEWLEEVAAATTDEAVRAPADAEPGVDAEHLEEDLHWLEQMELESERRAAAKQDADEDADGGEPRDAEEAPLDKNAADEIDEIVIAGDAEGRSDHEDDEPDEVLRRIGIHFARRPGQAELRMAVDGGCELRFNATECYIRAHCDNPEHGHYCHRRRTCNASEGVSQKARGQGRPIGALMAWLAKKDHCRTREEHMALGTQSYEERLAARQHFFTFEGAAGFAANEREQRTREGETEEPRILP